MFHTLFVFPFLISLLILATQVITSYRFSNGHGSPTWTQFQCIGNESRLEDCYYNTGVCQGYNTYTANFAIVGLKCEGDVIPPSNLFFLLFASFLMHIIYALKRSFEVSFSLWFPADNCAENSIRLNGPNGINTEEGRIELCSNGVWGTVGSTNFGYKDGRAACRQLQYGAPGNVSPFKYSYIHTCRPTHIHYACMHSTIMYAYPAPFCVQIIHVALMTRLSF